MSQRGWIDHRKALLNDAAVLDRIDAGTAIAGAFSAAPRSIGPRLVGRDNRIETGAQVSSIRLAKREHVWTRSRPNHL